MQTIPQNDTGGGAERRVSVTIRLPKSIDRAVELWAAQFDSTKQQLIEDALRSYLDQREHAA